MARKATGKVIDHAGTNGRIYRALRFTAYRRRCYVSAARPSARLRHTMADVKTVGSG